MKRFVVFLLFFGTLSSCSKYDLPKCGFDDATQDLNWLQVIINERNANPTEDMKYCYIVQADFKRKTVFIFRDCNPFVNKAVYVIDCEGDKVLDKEGEDVYAVDVSTELKNERLIWKPVDFACDLNN